MQVLVSYIDVPMSRYATVEADDDHGELPTPGAASEVFSLNALNNIEAVETKLLSWSHGLSVSAGRILRWSTHAFQQICITHAGWAFR
jgi:hypothetical protein